MRRRLMRLAVALGAAAVLAALAAAAFVARPLPPGLLDRRPLLAVRFTDRDGGLLREVRSRDDGRTVALPDGELPPQVVAAFVAAEDQRFFAHAGVDARAVARAAVQNVRAGHVVSGASTLSMQLARQLVARERTLPGKAREALWALRLEAHLDKPAILRAYLDRVPLGNSNLGVEAAAEFYFARPAARLSTGQAALLAGMATSPSRYDPYRHPQAAQARLERVLARMEALGSVSKEEARVARTTPLDLVPPAKAFRAPHLVAALSTALPSLGLDGATEVRTTLDPGLQADVEAALREELEGLKDRRVTQAAAIVLDNATGEVLAYAGSANFLDEASQGQNDGVRSLRQPGSALKPFAYGLALTRGRTPATVLSDVETHMSTPGGDYAPHNYDRRVHGPVRLRAALANSYNVPAVRIAEELGPDAVLEVLHRAGFASLTDSAEHYGVGLVLGNGDVTLRELARAYRGLARGGVLLPITELRAATDASGRALQVAPELRPRRFLPANAVALLTDVISDEEARAPAFGLDNALRLPFPVAAKTGTSRAYIDNWCAGFTKERTVAVWVGNFDGAPMRSVSGITGAAPIFKRVMKRAMKGLTPAPLVDRSRFDRADVCPLSGARATSACPGALHEVFLPGTAPVESCPMHRSVTGEDGRARAALDVGPEFYNWAHGEGLESSPLASPGAASGKARLLLPADGDEYLVDPGVPDGDQGIAVRALPPQGVGSLEVRVDSARTFTLKPPFAVRIPAERGEHRVELWVAGREAPEAAAHFTVH